MGIHREFTASCDTCGNHDPDTRFPWSSVVKDELRKDGWKVQNKLTCPACLGNDPDFWENFSWG